MHGSLLEVSAQEGARRVALGYLDQAAAAAQHLSGEEGDDALHDFRVGMRRLRSCLRAYDETLGDAVGSKLRRRLKRLAGATNPGRDSEVQLDWVLTVGDTEGTVEKHGVLWLAEQLRTRKDDAYARVRGELLAEFESLEGKLRKALSTYVVHHRVGETAESDFGAVAAEAVERALRALRKDLGAVHGIEDEALAHRARIHGKRLRYLLEPLRGDLEGARSTVRLCKALQDLLGDLNDLHNLSATVGEALELASIERARRLREIASRVDGTLELELATDREPGLIAMLQRIQRDRVSMFDSLMSDWLQPSGRLDALEAHVAELTARLRGEEDLEIERKYLLLGLPERCQELSPATLEQGYLPGERLIERVRKVSDKDSVAHLRTVKLGRGVRRIEIEETCAPEVYDALFALTAGRRVHKHRFEVPDGDLVWEVDRFLDRDLFLAEIELPTVDSEVTIPEWLVPYIVREVTDDPAYVNSNLAN